jgi:hypothetical protein
MAGRIVLVVACGALALATNHFLLHWVLLTDAYMQRLFFGA